MSENQQNKHIREVFKDFNLNGKNIMDAKICSINLIKKTNTLEISLISNELIEISSIYAFEKYLSLRFQIPNINIKVQIENIEETAEGMKENKSQDIDEIIKNDWNSLIDYMSYKHPMSKAILENSTVEINDSKLNIVLHKKGKEFLKSQKFDVMLSNIIDNIFGKKYKVFVCLL